MSINPYEAPQTFDVPDFPSDSPEEIRQRHISTETSLKAVGFLHYLGGTFMVLAGFLGMANLGSAGEFASVTNVTIALGFPVIGVLVFVLGRGVRKLKPWSRIGVGILSGIGLLAFPMGTLINAYILFLTFGKKGRMIFSDRYKEIIQVTPHVKCKTPASVWIILGIFVAIIVGGTITIVFGSR